ncbi:MAG: hypothetical protein MJ223_00145 [Mycoplasmoidaceae bacterium]|nr:hypothetical protein [Mycoplasmoidaceae bacterium]
MNEYYKQTNKLIRDILNDPKRMNSLRQTILEEKIADSICKKLKFKLDREAILKNAAASQQAAKEASAKSKEQKPTKQEKK